MCSCDLGHGRVATVSIPHGKLRLEERESICQRDHVSSEGLEKMSKREVSSVHNPHTSLQRHVAAA